MKLKLHFSFLFGGLYIVLHANLIQCQRQLFESEYEKDVAAFLAKHTSNDSNFNLDTWDPPEDMKKNLVYYQAGYDEEKRPIWIAEWGKWDVKKYVDAGGEIFKTYDRYADQQMVRIMQSITKRYSEANPVKEIVFIIDVEDYPIEQLSSVSALTYNLRKFAAWAPLGHAIEKGFVLNTNFLAERVLNLVKPLLGRVFEHFEIYGTNKASWIPKLLKHIPRSELPEWYGGTKDFKPVAVYGR